MSDDKYQTLNILTKAMVKDLKTISALNGVEGNKTTLIELRKLLRNIIKEEAERLQLNRDLVSKPSKPQRTMTLYEAMKGNNT